MSSMRARVLFIALFVFAVIGARADMAVLVGEPYGAFGTMMPQGHTAVYFDHVCADGPLHLRLCEAGEAGVVISRYHELANVDWLATPALVYLYGVERTQDVPAFATKPLARELEDQYRHRELMALIPDKQHGAVHRGEWIEAVGETFHRRLWAYRVTTTLQQDEQFIAWLNAQPNKHRYRLQTANCADFAADAVNFYFPGSVSVNKPADMGMMTPKQVAHSMMQLGEQRPDLEFQLAEIPQLPGTFGRSHKVQGAWEALIKQKRYFAAVLVLQPEVLIIAATKYMRHGRFSITDGAVAVGPGWFARQNELATTEDKPATSGQ